MTDELEGETITEFVSGGPKNYGYTTSSGKVVTKVRGFTLNVRGSKQLNYQVMKQNVIDEITHPLESRRQTDVVNPFFFTRNPTTKKIKVTLRTKQYGLVFDKCVVDPDTFQTFPYGFKRLDSNDVQMIETLLAI